MPDNQTNYDFFKDLKDKGTSAKEAVDAAAERGMEEISIVRMLREVYGLSFFTAADLARQPN
ncbi:hypothetical protein FKG94_02765 [Exilibacterium tricleocarpae]|uniref:Uncharacterized protein n=1 Tax=Exilibacterium tricleocarpae TaxID=2591008 RepID=A0A545U6N3_9GAMM|nr:hypothetical protein [Exilibacterium tricleocarpae]TQV85128.1 hypothetical protein FKG94_02765 [Exilibacterium tricleocarpae]